MKKQSADDLHELVVEFQRLVKALVIIMSYTLDPPTLRAWEEMTDQQDDVEYNDLVEFSYQRSQRCSPQQFVPK